jgi:hypothetical protein
LSRQFGEGKLNFNKSLRYISAAAIVAAAGYFFYLQFKDNADIISTYDFTVNPYYLFISIIFGIFALLIGPFVWRSYVNSYLSLHEKLSFTESFALYCTSSMFKYIPGKIWTYAAQIALMSSKGISMVVLLYINMVSFICLIFVAAMFSLYYYFFCMHAAAWGISAFIFILLIITDVIFIIWNDSIINYLIVPVNRIFKLEIEPIKTKKSIFIYTQMLYFLACLFLGMALYFLARGINIDISFSNIFAIMATISISLVLGLLAFFTIGGLGVREGTMFFMLKQFSNMQAALILPVVARFLTIIVELLIVIVAIIIGMKYGYFSNFSKSRQKNILQ